MLTFIHGYLPESFPALVRSGLFGADSGLKITHCGAHVPGSPRSFNTLAAPGSPLDAALEAYKPLFYIDRLMGGTYYYQYPWDASLLRRIEERLGPRFLGFQLHEWSSNLRQDWLRLEKALSAPAPWSESAIVEGLQAAFPQLPGVIYLEAGSAKEFSQIPFPSDIPAFLAASRKLLQRRMEETGGRLVAADSCFQAARLETEAGVRHLMPELGAQTPFTRIQTALNRGMARAWGIDFGAYYEPWGGNPFSCCSCHTGGDNEWLSGEDDGEPLATPFSILGENGGSSRALQRRIYFHSLFAGAAYLSDEHGTCNTFQDHHDFALSSYGRVKKEFLDFARAYPEAGDLVTPIALLLPRSLPILDLSFLAREDAAPSYLMGYALTEGALSDAQKVRKALRQIFANPQPHLGNEGHALTNSPYPDAFDILWEDAPSGALARYSQVLRLTEDWDVLGPAIRRTLEAALPLRIEGSIEAMLNRVSDGYLLALLHNEGIERSVDHGDRPLPGSASRVSLHPLRPLALEPLWGGKDLAHPAEDTWQVTVPPGGIAVLRVRL